MGQRAREGHHKTGMAILLGLAAGAAIAGAASGAFKQVAKNVVDNTIKNSVDQVEKSLEPCIDHDINTNTISASGDCTVKGNTQSIDTHYNISCVQTVKQEAKSRQSVSNIVQQQAKVISQNLSLAFEGSSSDNTVKSLTQLSSDIHEAIVQKCIIDGDNKNVITCKGSATVEGQTQSINSSDTVSCAQNAVQGQQSYQSTVNDIAQKATNIQKNTLAGIIKAWESGIIAVVAVIGVIVLLVIMLPLIMGSAGHHKGTDAFKAAHGLTTSSSAAPTGGSHVVGFRGATR